MLIFINIIEIILETLILVIYASIIVKIGKKTEKKIKFLKELIQEQNEKIKLLKNELDEIEGETLDNL